MTKDLKQRIESTIKEILASEPLDPRTLTDMVIAKIGNGNAIEDEIEALLESMKDRFIITETPRRLLMLNK